MRCASGPKTLSVASALLSRSPPLVGRTPVAFPNCRGCVQHPPASSGVSAVLHPWETHPLEQRCLGRRRSPPITSRWGENSCIQTQFMQELCTSNKFTGFLSYSLSSTKTKAHRGRTAHKKLSQSLLFLWQLFLLLLLFPHHVFR